MSARSLFRSACNDQTMQRSPPSRAVKAIALFFACTVSPAASQCGSLVKRVAFGGADLGAGSIESYLPYTETLAYHDWAPYSYLDGFYDDPSTIGTDNRRASLVNSTDSTHVGNPHLRVKLPAGCVKSECAMQTKSALLQPLDQATLKFSVRFGEDFDWVKGGKLPGLCGGNCLTGCKQVTGLDGFSARQMWRPCAWPPSNREPCSGGRLVAYLYHMFKIHWCGDDIVFADFEPVPETWYTIWSHVRMNDAGPESAPVAFERNGVLETWIRGPTGPATRVIQIDDLAWRQFSNVSIDTLYFSVFFGGSSRTFAPKKDETIDFGGFEVFSGRCTPADEPLPVDLEPVLPVWPEQAADLAPGAPATTVAASLVFTKMFVGGACVDLHLRNTASEACSGIEAVVGVRPSWGRLLTRDGQPSLSQLALLEMNATSGTIRADVALRKPLAAGGTDDRASFCVTNYSKSKYLPDDMGAHVVAAARCTATGTVSPPEVSRPPQTPPQDATSPEPSEIQGQAERDDRPPAPPWSPGARPTSCSTPAYSLAVSATPDDYIFCLDVDATYVGAGTCYEFAGSALLDPTFANLRKSRGVLSTRAPVSFLDRDTGRIEFSSPSWYERAVSGQDKGEPFSTSLCGWYSSAFRGTGATAERVRQAFSELTVTCTRCD